MQAETCAFRSPTISRGIRQLAWMNSKTVSTGAPLSYETNPGDPQPFLEHVGAVTGDRPGHPPADVAVMRNGDCETDSLPLEEHRLDDEDVRRVARAVERIVDDVDVAGSKVVSEALEHHLDHVRYRSELEWDRDGLSDRLARRAAESRGEVHGVADDRGVGGTEDGRRHLVGNRGQAVGDDLACDRIRSRSSEPEPGRWRASIRSRTSAPLS